MRQVARLRAVTEAVGRMGSAITYEPGWETRGFTGFYPAGHVTHHDGVPFDAMRTVRDGRSDLPYLLGNWYLHRSGLLRALGAGVATHAGSGGWDGLRGNSQVWGLEVDHDGSGRLAPAQERTLRRHHVALAVVDRIPVRRLCSHHEWRPTGRYAKWDLGINGRPMNMHAERLAVAAQINGGDIVTPQDKADIANQAAMLAVAAMEARKLFARVDGIHAEVAAVDPQALDPVTLQPTTRLQRLGRNVQGLSEKLVPGTTFRRGIASWGDRPASSSVNEEDIAHAVVAGVAIQLQQLAEQGVKVDLSALDPQRIGVAVADELAGRLSS
jgi:hypothetical protein